MVVCDIGKPINGVLRWQGLRRQAPGKEAGYRTPVNGLVQVWKFQSSQQTVFLRIVHIYLIPGVRYAERSTLIVLIMESGRHGYGLSRRHGFVRAEGIIADANHQAALIGQFYGTGIPVAVAYIRIWVPRCRSTSGQAK